MIEKKVVQIEEYFIEKEGEGLRVCRGGGGGGGGGRIGQKAGT